MTAEVIATRLASTPLQNAWILFHLSLLEAGLRPLDLDNHG